jgi:hypothetical protein
VIYQAFKAEVRENDAGRDIDFGRLCFVVHPDLDVQPACGSRASQDPELR